MKKIWSLTLVFFLSLTGLAMAGVGLLLTDSHPGEQVLPAVEHDGRSDKALMTLDHEPKVYRHLGVIRQRLSESGVDPNMAVKSAPGESGAEGTRTEPLSSARASQIRRR